ncbi:MAG: RDD family protein [Coprobacillus sp.]|nr:RDD family protein [Coprobacillus sp.]
MSAQDDDYLGNIHDPHIEIQPEERLEVQYANPKFWHRCVANLIDFLIAVVIFFIVFICARAIVRATPEYKENDAELYDAQISSGLYIDDADMGVTNITSYLSTWDYTGYTRMIMAQDAIEVFFEFIDEKCDEETAEMVRGTYDTERLSDTFVDSYGQHYFVIDEESGEVIINRACYNVIGAQAYFDNFYTYYIDEVLQGYLIVAVPNYYELTKYMSNVLIYAEILPAFCFAGVLTWYVPTWIFKRGWKTFGKAIYHIGVVDKRLLNPPWWKSLVRFLIFFFFELVLSVFTFGIPIIISFTMMAFDRNKQGFPDYMLSLVEVSTADNKIYYNYDEIKIDLVRTAKKPVEFHHSDLNLH